MPTCANPLLLLLLLLVPCSAAPALLPLQIFLLVLQQSGMRSFPDAYWTSARPVQSLREMSDDVTSGPLLASCLVDE